jgi:hypothetical protein
MIDLARVEVLEAALKQVFTQLGFKSYGILVEESIIDGEIKIIATLKINEVLPNDRKTR